MFINRRPDILKPNLSFRNFDQNWKRDQLLPALASLISFKHRVVDIIWNGNLGGTVDKIMERRPKNRYFHVFFVVLNESLRLFCDSLLKKVPLT